MARSVTSNNVILRPHLICIFPSTTLFLEAFLFSNFLKSILDLALWSFSWVKPSLTFMTNCTSDCHPLKILRYQICLWPFSPLCSNLFSSSAMYQFDRHSLKKVVYFPVKLDNNVVCLFFPSIVFISCYSQVPQQLYLTWISHFLLALFISSISNICCYQNPTCTEILIYILIISISNPAFFSFIVFLNLGVSEDLECCCCTANFSVFKVLYSWSFLWRLVAALTTAPHYLLTLH